MDESDNISESSLQKRNENKRYISGSAEGWFEVNEGALGSIHGEWI